MLDMFNRLKSFSLVAVSVGLVAALLLGSAVPAKAAGERAVKIGFNCAFTGVLATETVSGHEAQIDYVKWVNEHGGIDGIRVQARWEDYGSLGSRAITTYKRLVEWGALVTTNFLDTAMSAPRHKRDKISGVYMPGAVSSVLVTEPPWIIGSGSEAENYAVSWIEWFLEDWTEDHPLRWGAMCADLPAPRDIQINSVPYVLERAGGRVEYVGYEVIPYAGVIDTTTEWLRLAAKRPDWITVSHYGGSMVTIVKDAARLGIQEKGIKLLADHATLEESILRIVGKAGEDWYRSTLDPLSSMAELPGMKCILEAAKKYRGREPEDVTIAYTKGWVGTAIALEGIRLAIEEVGFENLTGEAVREGLFSIRDFDLGLGPPFIITEDKPYYNDYWYPAHIEKGRIVPLTDWRRVSRVAHYVLVNGEVRTEHL